MIKDRSYFRDYLCKYLTDENDPRKDDDVFIDARVRENLTVNQAEERAIAVLMEGF